MNYTILGDMMKENLSRLNGKMITTTQLAEALTDDYLSNPGNEDLILVEIWNPTRVMDIFEGSKEEITEEQAKSILQAAARTLNNDSSLGLSMTLMINLAYELGYRTELGLTWDGWSPSRIKAIILNDALEMNAEIKQDALETITTTVRARIIELKKEGVTIDRQLITTLISDAHVAYEGFPYEQA